MGLDMFLTPVGCQCLPPGVSQVNVNLLLITKLSLHLYMLLTLFVRPLPTVVNPTVDLSLRSSTVWEESKKVYSSPSILQHSILRPP